GLSIDGNARVSLPAQPTGGGSVRVRVGTLSVPNGILDLGNNNMIVTAPGSIGSWDGAAYTGVTGLLASGRNGGAPGAGNWGGNGIVTSQSNATSGNFTTLAVATAQQVKSLANPGDTAVWAG